MRHELTITSYNNLGSKLFKEGDVESLILAIYMLQMSSYFA
jgi:hypothetical protein